MQPNDKSDCLLTQTINMKKFLIAGLMPLMFAACLKSNNSSATCSDVAPAAEATQIQAYCDANSIDYVVDSSGIYYQIVNPGEAEKPTVNSTVSTTYVGKLLNGTTIDQSSTPYQAQLNMLIAAWQIGLQKIGKGGHIKMVAPSSLCYGCYGYPPTVPSNAILFFDITLVDFQ